MAASILGRSPRGSVDRNVKAVIAYDGTWASLPTRERGSKRATIWPACRSRWSLPTRERGSKLADPQSRSWTLASLPTRERGSKRVHSRSVDAQLASLPTRERGSKRPNQFCNLGEAVVAPHAGAWIETSVYPALWSKLTKPENQRDGGAR